MRELYAACKSTKTNLKALKIGKTHAEERTLATRLLMRCPKTFDVVSRSESHEGFIAEGHPSILRSVCLGSGPARKHEGDLVDKVRNVVDHIEGGFIHTVLEVAKQVARRINGPANRDDEAHVVVRGRDGRTAIVHGTTCFAAEDLVQDEEPAAQAKTEARCRWHCLNLPQISEKEHAHGADQEPPEHVSACVLASSLEDQVELNHLQWDSDAPVHVPVNDG